MGLVVNKLPFGYIILSVFHFHGPRVEDTNSTTLTLTTVLIWCLDCRRGQSLVVWAISEGRQAAREVDAFLMGSSTLPGPGGVITVTASNQKG
jgi:hypothetical protein